MSRSYRSNYLKIYFWQGLSICLGFLALFVVLPYISSNKQIFGVYSLCISLTVFLSYADLGFVSAGFKFASESFSRQDREGEVRIIGFVAFILACFGIVYSLLILGVSFNPRLVFSDLEPGVSMNVARKLLLILGFASLNMIYQRVLQIIFGIRLEDYVLRRIAIAGNLASLASVFWFFGRGHYDIVGYYLFTQVASVLVSIIASFVLVGRYGYPFRNLLRAIRFDSLAFRITKGLAFASFLGTLGWIIFYELDSLFISKMMGVNALALYAVCLSLVNFLRSLLGTLYSPFQARFNHFIGVSDVEGLRDLYGKSTRFFAPIIFFPTLAIIALMGPFLTAWVGPDYSQSVLPGQLLIGIYLLSFMQYPGGILLSAQLRTREMNWITLLNVGLFWGGVLITYRSWGILSLAVFKLLNFVVSGLYFTFVSTRFVGYPGYPLKDIFRFLLPLGFLLFMGLSYSVPLFSGGKGALMMIEVIGAGVAAVLISLLLYFKFNNQWHDLVLAQVRFKK